MNDIPQTPVGFLSLGLKQKHQRYVLDCVQQRLNGTVQILVFQQQLLALTLKFPFPINKPVVIYTRELKT